MLVLVACGVLAQAALVARVLAAGVARHVAVMDAVVSLMLALMVALAELEVLRTVVIPGPMGLRLVLATRERVRSAPPRGRSQHPVD